MKIVVVSGAFPPASMAEANHALHLAEALTRYGAEIHVLTTQGAVTEGLPFTVHALMRDWSWKDVPRFARFLRRCRPDAVLMIYIGFAYNDHPMATFAPTIAKMVLPDVPFVTQFENAMGVLTGRCTLPTRVLRKLLALYVGTRGVDYEFGTLLRDSDRVIVLGGRHETRLIQRYPPTALKSALIPPPPIVRIIQGPNGSARGAGRDLLGIKPDEFVLTYFGYLYPSKGLETLLRAFQLVRSRGRNARLVIAGGVAAHLHEERASYVKELEGLAAALGVEADIVWTGFLPWDSDDASLCLHAADVCVLPFDEGISLHNSTFAAAATHGLPIITTRGESIEPPFRPNENVVLCPPRDPAALAEAIAELIDRPELRQTLTSGVRRMRDEWFSWERAAARIVATLTPSQ
jgi:polysaccharide biosynthesis protein PslF